jgi:ABC-type multidrug transport system ATPase subunit
MCVAYSSEPNGAYTIKDDAMNAFLTVRETLDLAAAFQMPSIASRADRNNYVIAVMNEVLTIK